MFVVAPVGCGLVGEAPEEAGGDVVVVAVVAVVDVPVEVTLVVAVVEGVLDSVDVPVEATLVVAVDVCVVVAVDICVDVAVDVCVVVAVDVCVVVDHAHPGAIWTDSVLLTRSSKSPSQMSR